MHRRQTGFPNRWLIADHRLGDQLWASVARLPRGSGILFLCHGLGGRQRSALLRKLRILGRTKGLTIVDEATGAAVRVHDVRELRRALLGPARMILLSPLYPTRSHPEWEALPRMREAALARLGGRRLVALGGMDADRFRRVSRLGFSGWAAIDGLRT